MADPFGETEAQVLSPFSGIIIGRTNLPLSNEGDALFHIARFDKIKQVATGVEAFAEQHEPEIPRLPTPESPII